MAEERLQRRLAAILSADVVGYSRLMGMDEAGTLSRLNALRRELIDPTITAHSGRIVKLMGDGALVEFASAVNAVTCAIEIQRRVQERAAAEVEANPLQFRIGINVGDIIIDGQDILGDGVNIASRIEGTAEPGGIAISEDAWRQVQGKVAANFIDAGEQNLKNIARPVRIYRLGLTQNAKSEPLRTTQAPSEKPSIAVLTPYRAQADRLQQRIAESLKGDLSHLTGFKPARSDGGIVSTVDSFQGNDADLVVVSLVRNNPHVGKRALGFLSDSRRMNVLLSRAKFKLVIVGSLRFVKEAVRGVNPTGGKHELSFLTDVIATIEKLTKEKRRVSADGDSREIALATVIRPRSLRNEA